MAVPLFTAFSTAKRYRKVVSLFGPYSYRPALLVYPVFFALFAPQFNGFFTFLARIRPDFA
jgi:hypothetical protein